MGLRIAFFGTPAFAVPSLQALHAAGHTIALVVTQPDRPRGRGHRVEPSPIKSFALTHGLDVVQPDRLRDEGFMEEIRSRQIDLGVVAAYGKILPSSLLETPRLGMINVHASLLPRWRGAAPIHRAVLAGDKETGVTIMRVVAALDAGPMLDAQATPIDIDETSAELEARLASIGAELAVRTVRNLAAGPVEEVPQDEGKVTYAERLQRRESRVDWSRSSLDVHNQIRGLQPWPMAVVLWRGKRLTLRRSRLTTDAAVPAAPPGTVAALQRDALIVATGDGGIAVTEVQLEGRPATTAADFLNGHRLVPGERFDALPVE